MEKQTDSKAVDTLLENGIEFTVWLTILGRRIKKKFSIRPLKLSTILSISKQRNELTEVDPEKEILIEELEKAGNVTVFAKCISLAIINNRFKARYVHWILWRLLFKSLSMKECHSLMSVVLTQLNPKDFFLTTISVSGVSIIRRTKAQDTSQKKQSGGQSEKSAKS